jgi:pyruvate/2-oxoglutarate dehydrogenase complex dihydrolipoamide acyltransferase (E2) component
MSRSESASGWRRIASAVWSSPADPQIYGDIEVDATALLSFIDTVRRVTGTRVTVTHLVGKAVAHALAEHPELNTFLSRGRFVSHDSVDIFFVVSIPGGRDLSGVKVRHAETKSLTEIAAELERRAAAVRTGEDGEYGKTKALTDAVPLRLLRVVLRLADWLTGDLKVDLKRFGMPRELFGSAMVTSVGMFGVGRAYGPLSPYYRIPFLALVSEVAPKAVVVDGDVVARPVLTICATMDHRYLDGAHAARLAHSVRTYLENPAAHEPAPDPVPHGDGGGPAR